MSQATRAGAGQAAAVELEEIERAAWRTALRCLRCQSMALWEHAAPTGDSSDCWRYCDEHDRPHHGATRARLVQPEAGTVAAVRIARAALQDVANARVAGRDELAEELLALVPPDLRDRRLDIRRTFRVFMDAALADGASSPGGARVDAAGVPDSVSVGDEVRVRDWNAGEAPSAWSVVTQLHVGGRDVERVSSRDSEAAGVMISAAGRSWYVPSGRWSRDVLGVRRATPAPTTAGAGIGSEQKPHDPGGVRTLHLITQRDQPYGSARTCCEACGAYGALNDPGHDWTDSPDLFGAPPATHRACNDRRAIDGSAAVAASP